MAQRYVNADGTQSTQRLSICTSSSDALILRFWAKQKQTFQTSTEVLYRGGQPHTGKAVEDILVLMTPYAGVLMTGTVALRPMNARTRISCSRASDGLPRVKRCGIGFSIGGC
jgi:hypothetical protein